MQSETLVALTNNHKLPLPEIDVADRYLSVFEGRSGDQVVLLIDRETGVGELLHGDMEWKSYPMSKDSPFPSVYLSTPERLWVAACWIAALRLTEVECAPVLAEM